MPSILKKSVLKRIMLSLLIIILMIILGQLLVDGVQAAPIDFSHVWFQHINQILYVYDQLSQPMDHSWNDGGGGCRSSMQQLVKDAQSKKYYANKMIDSIGRPTSGILEGRLTYLGQYDECLAATGKTFSGKYCIAHIQLPNNFTYILSNIAGVSYSLYKNLPVKLGVCLPSTCTSEDVSKLAHKFSNMFKPTLSVKVIECMESNDTTSEHIDVISLSIFSGVCSLIFLLVLIGTMLTNFNPCTWFSHCGEKNLDQLAHYEPINEKTFGKKFLLAFSVKENLNKILQVNASNESINVFHGIKFFAMIWIIFTHSISFSNTWINFNNQLDIKRTTYNIFSQILVNGTFSVDCFFFISGYLVMHNLKHYMESNQRRFNLAIFYLNRYIRMTPTMMFIIGFGATMLRYFGSGPEWTNSTVMFDLWCRKNWWINLLYLHNFIDTDNMCLSHSWYSAVDTQFFIISPFLILLLIKRPRIGIALCMLMVFGSICITWALTVLNNYPAVPYFNDIIPLDVLNSYYQNIYIKPYCRLGPYIVGLLLAYSILNNKDSSIKLSKACLFVGWTFTIASTLGIVLAMLPANNGHIPDVQIAAIYSSTSRIVWSLGLSWITFVSVKNQGGFVQKFLSLKLWIPLSRLTYCAYLVNPIIIGLFYGTRQQTFDYSFYLILYFTLSNICITYIVSFLLALFIEYPLMSIGKFVLKRD